MGLQQFERRLERLVEGAFAKAFRSGLQPVELGRRLSREMDLQRTVGVHGLIAPNHFQIAVSPDDAEQFSSFSEALVRELSEAVREHARDEGYNFVGPVQVALEPDPSMGKGEFLVASEIVSGPGGHAAGSLHLPDGTRIAIGDEPVTIGRQAECDVVLEDSNVSRRHAEVRRDGETYVLVDVGSTNGSKVNGTRVKQQALSDGDEITLGKTVIRFEAS
ncbi:MAG: FHA domain-containing protein [Acidimicrobiia bacterium]|nr:FHA domain-containing protein [Acidimicrobiia bacterium]